MGKKELFFAILLIASLFSIATFHNLQPQRANLGIDSGVQLKITDIFANGNAQLGSAASSGNGSAGSPYIIEYQVIDSPSFNCILIRNTDAHFIIRHCYLANAGLGYVGIGLLNVTNGKIINCTIHNCNGGLVLEDANYNWIINTTVNYSRTWGVDVRSGSSHNTFQNNTISFNNWDNAWGGIAIRGSSNDNSFHENTLNNNTFYALEIEDSNNNIITWNTFSGNDETWRELGTSTGNVINNNVGAQDKPTGNGNGNGDDGPPGYLWIIIGAAIGAGVAVVVLYMFYFKRKA